MTGFAFCLLYFIQYIGGLSFGFVLMTAGAVDFRVLSVQFISRLIVVKIFYFPDTGCMAARTIRGAHYSQIAFDAHLHGNLHNFG